MKDLPDASKLAELNKTYTLSEIAKQHGVSRQVIHYRLKRAGFKTIIHPERRRLRSRLPPSEELLRLYRKKSVREIAETYDVDPSLIYVRLKECPDYKPGKHRRKLPSTEKIEELLSQGMTQAEIARRYGVFNSAVHNRLSKKRKKEQYLEGSRNGN